MADVLKRTIRARSHIVANEVTRYDQEFLDSDRACTETVHQRIVLAAAMADPSEVDISNLTTAAVLMIETDRAVTVYLNQTGPTFANGISLADAGMLMLVGPVTAVYVQNVNATYTATIELLATD
jgi:hypothetical protein